MADGEGDLIGQVIILASVLLPSCRVVGKCLEPYQPVIVRTRNYIFVLATSSGPACIFIKMGPKVLFPPVQTGTGTSTTLQPTERR